jgi:hypothetical protein
LLLLQPDQLPFEPFVLLHTPADQDQQLLNDLFGGQNPGFPLLLASERSPMLRPIVMSGLPITPLSQRGLWVARRGYRLVDTDHRTDSSKGGAVCPAQNEPIGGITEVLPSKALEIEDLCSRLREMVILFLSLPLPIP